LNVFSISLPPLRARPEDIPLLAQHFLEQFSRQMNRTFTGFEPKAMDLLVRYPWPGNVRELANAVERALVVGKLPTIQARDLPVQLSDSPPIPAGDALAAMERTHIESILERTDWNITRSAEILQVDRGTLYNKIKKYGLSR
jgi:DNA-binding NtrC family response regulator